MEFLPSFSSVVVLEGAFIFQSAVGGGAWVGGGLVVVVLQLGVFIFKSRRGAPLVLMEGFHKKNYEMGGTPAPSPLAKTLQKGAIMQLFKSRA